MKRFWFWLTNYTGVVNEMRFGGVNPPDYTDFLVGLLFWLIIGLGLTHLIWYRFTH